MKTKSLPVAIISLLFWVAVTIALCVGWVLNIFTIANSNLELTGIFVLRIIGIFIAPLGAVLGYF